MKTIIAPTDFSPVSLNAVNYAADMACLTGAHLTLIHIYAIPMPIGEVPMPAFDTGVVEESAKTRLKELKEQLLDRTHDRVIIHTEVKAGDVINELTHYCDKIRPAAVVMGAETTGGFERLFLGGKAVGAVKHLEWPVLVVPSLIQFKNIRRIGLACDLREVVDSVRVTEIRELVKEFGAELHVLHVTEENRDTYSAETVEESGLLQEMLGDMHPKYHFINDAVVEQGVVEFADKLKLDLLIIIPKSHNLLARIFRYSHSKQIVLHAHMPVLALHE